MKKSKGKKSKSLAKRPSEVGQTAAASTTIVSETATWSGPMPPPEQLQEFENIVPGSAERILIMAENQQDHRKLAESTILSANILDTQRGQYLGSAVSVLAICGAVLAVYLGAHPVVSVALVGVPLVAVVKALVESRSN
ncbi:MAG: DUF2335 domain-containing protein [Candidatus Marinimicrobia bacterium]|nr:DUF2335 domain-containing protein [Candidatus Neomarinimicrobiota bacterium]